jgi:hypothetical protein
MTGNANTGSVDPGIPKTLEAGRSQTTIRKEGYLGNRGIRRKMSTKSD